MVTTNQFNITYFSDVVNIGMKIAGVSERQTDHEDNFKTWTSEWHETICTERNWHWRNFDRSFIFDLAIDTGTVAVTEDSRIVTFTGLTISRDHLGRSISINNERELYRIVGFSTATNQVYLDSAYVGETDVSTTYKMYNYEFSLPNDCDDVNSLIVSGVGEIELVSPNEFKRYLNSGLLPKANPFVYCRDALHLNPNGLIPPLGEWVLNYDFLGYNDNSGVRGDRISLYPIEPDRKRKIDINYSIQVPSYTDDGRPLIPKSDRWVLLNFVLADYHRANGNLQLSGSYQSKAMKRLKEMRAEHKANEQKPKLIINARKFHRTSIASVSRKSNGMDIEFEGE